ncbi:MAG TPA: hypothetical protein VGH27_21590 [Streptosporangiaceae bacterium]
MSDHHQREMFKWWAMLLAGVAAALVFAWLGRVAGVTLSTLLAIGAGGVALGWLIVLVSVPWNLYFAARRAVADMALSRDRGITVRPGHDAEAGRIARRMLWSALVAHLATAAAAALIAYFSGREVGYYFAGFFLLSAAARPGLAYLAHVRKRITVLGREGQYPRDDVVSLKATVGALTDDLKEARAEQARLGEAFLRTRNDVERRVDRVARQMDQMTGRIEDTLDGISDHQELLTGIRALARMFRPDPA